MMKSMFDKKKWMMNYIRLRSVFNRKYILHRCQDPASKSD